MSEIKQMYLNAYYGDKHYEEADMPKSEDLNNFKPDEVKAAYRKNGLK